jgi:hypothetical protein
MQLHGGSDLSWTELAGLEYWLSWRVTQRGTRMVTHAVVSA